MCRRLVEVYGSWNAVINRQSQLFSHEHSYGLFHSDFWFSIFYDDLMQTIILGGDPYTCSK